MEIILEMFTMSEDNVYLLITMMLDTVLKYFLIKNAKVLTKFTYTKETCIMTVNGKHYLVIILTSLMNKHQA
jgi:hypothetical protein